MLTLDLIKSYGHVWEMEYKYREFHINKFLFESHSLLLHRTEHYLVLKIVHIEMPITQMLKNTDNNHFLWDSALFEGEGKQLDSIQILLSGINSTVHFSQWLLFIF